METRERESMVGKILEKGEILVDNEKSEGVVGAESGESMAEDRCRRGESEV